MEWSAFRNGRPLTVDASTDVRYADLAEAGFAPFYAKVAFTMLRRGDADAALLGRWLASADDPKRAASIKAELRAYHEADAAGRASAVGDGAEPVARTSRRARLRAAPGEGSGRSQGASGDATGTSAPAPARRRARRGRTRGDDRFVLVARGGSPAHARREAQRLGLAPVETNVVDPARGEVTTRLEVEATAQQATTLTLSGFWMHRPDDERPSEAPAPRVRTRSRRD